MIKLYNRRTKEYIEKKVPVGLSFLYNYACGRLLLKSLTKPVFSKINGRILNSKLSKILIPHFIKKNQLKMNEYEKQTYQSFNDFFTRQIIKNKRPISCLSNDLIAPADSKLMVYQINDENIIKIKNSSYTITELIADSHLAKEYLNGLCLVFRLGVEDYHHYIFLDNGTCSNSISIKGKLHTVNPIAYNKYRVFKENSREYTILSTANFGKVIQIEVGALNVGKIKNNLVKKFSRGDEKGYFEFGGSTIVILIKDNLVTIDQDILDNSKREIETIVKLGEIIGHKKTKR